MVLLDELAFPIVLAPMAGGPSTPELAAAVSAAGGLGMLAAAYLDGETLAKQLAAARALTTAALGVNLFVPSTPSPPQRYREYLRGIAGAGTARYSDDGYAQKIALLSTDHPVAVVSFAFGCPDAATVSVLHAAGSEVWVTVTSAQEARLARERGADAVIAQGAEAGGHRGGFSDDPATDLTDPLTSLALLQLLPGAGLPVVLAGGIATGAGVAAALAGGASAVQVGTAFLRCPEAGTAAVHRDALAQDTPTALTRAFSGRRARGILNEFITEHSAGAPAAYPEVHYATAQLRQDARAAGDGGRVSMWAGQTHVLAQDEPAAAVVQRLGAEARTALDAARLWFDRRG